MPASVTPMASATAIAPSGIASIAARVEMGEAQLAGVARSSRAGTKRKVKAGPATRGWSGFSGDVPAHPDIAQALLQKHRRDGGGGHLPGSLDHGWGECHRKAFPLGQLDDLKSH